MKAKTNARNEPPTSAWQPLGKPLRVQILEQLAPWPATVRKIAHHVSGDARQVRACCRQMIEEGLLTSTRGEVEHLNDDLLLTITDYGRQHLQVARDAERFPRNMTRFLPAGPPSTPASPADSSVYGPGTFREVPDSAPEGC